MTKTANNLPVEISNLRNAICPTIDEVRALIRSRIEMKNDLLSHADGSRLGPKTAAARLKTEGALEQLASILDYMDGV